MKENCIICNISAKKHYQSGMLKFSTQGIIVGAICETDLNLLLRVKLESQKQKQQFDSHELASLTRSVFFKITELEKTVPALINRKEIKDRFISKVILDKIMGLSCV